MFQTTDTGHSLDALCGLKWACMGVTGFELVYHESVYYYCSLFYVQNRSGCREDPVAVQEHWR